MTSYFSPLATFGRISGKSLYQGVAASQKIGEMKFFQRNMWGGGDNFGSKKALLAMKVPFIASNTIFEGKHRNTMTSFLLEEGDLTMPYLED